MPKTDPSISLEDYTPVADRIELFYSRFPGGRITTKLLPGNDRDVVVKAFVYRRSEDTLPAATGLASERFGDGTINMHSCLENTETSAIGRALANLGFAASKKRPSREEMEKVERARNSLGYRAPAKSRLREPQVKPPVGQSTAYGLNHDLFVIIERAEASGFSTRRAEIIRESLVKDPPLSMESTLRLEARLRAWMLRRMRTLTRG